MEQEGFHTVRAAPPYSGHNVRIVQLRKGEEAIRSVTLIVYQNRHLDRTPVEKGGAGVPGAASAPDLLASLIHLF